MKKYKAIGHYDYLQGHLRTGYSEVEFSKEELEHFKTLSEEEQAEFINEVGNVICDDYEIEDRGEICEIDILEE